MGWGMMFALFLSLIVAVVVYHMFKKIMVLLVHGVMGIAIFWALSALGILKVPIDIVTFLVAAFGGVIGVATVIILSILGVPL